MSEETTSTETLAPTTSDIDATALGGVEAAPVEASEQSGETALGSKPDEAAETTEEAAKAPDVPESYELTAPEGMTLDAASVELATPVFKELGLSNEQANKLMPVAAAFAQKIQDHANQQIIAQVQADRKAWLDTAKADSEIGGAHWGDTIATAASALDKLGMTKGTPFRNLLDESGLGNHPEMIRAFQKVGKAIGDDATFARAGASPAQKSHASILYGTK